MSTVHQISVFLENRSGSLAEITRQLAEKNVNLRAISIAESADWGVLRLIADDCARAVSALQEKGCVLTETPVTVVAVPDEPAGLSRVLEIMAEDKIDIEYMYSLFTHEDGKAYMVFRVTHVEPFLALLKKKGLVSVSNEELGLK